MSKSELVDLLLSGSAEVGGVITGTTNKSINIHFMGTLSQLKAAYPDFSRKIFIDVAVYHAGREYNENVISCLYITKLARA